MAYLLLIIYLLVINVCIYYIKIYKPYIFNTKNIYNFALLCAFWKEFYLTEVCIYVYFLGNVQKFKKKISTILVKSWKFLFFIGSKIFLGLNIRSDFWVNLFCWDDSFQWISQTGSHIGLNDSLANCSKSKLVLTILMH